MTSGTFDRTTAATLAIDRFSPAVLLPLALLFGVVGQHLFYGVGLGLNFALASALLVLAAFALRPAGARVDPLDRWIAPAALVFGVLPAVRTDAMLLLFDVPATLVLVAMSAAACAGVPLTRRAADLLAALGLVVFGRLIAGGAVLAAAFPRLTLPLARRAGGRLVSVGVGLVLALPLLVVFTVLFSSADAVFRSSLTSLFDLKRWSLGEMVGRTLLALVLAWLAGGVFLLAGRGAETSFPAVLPRLRGLLSATAATTMLVALDALFGFFVALQVTYLFGGVDTLNATGITYSDYARRGFFELIDVAFLAGAVLFVVELVVARRTPAFVVAAIALLASTLVVVISAAYRMHLYQLAYGWTEQRFYALAGIVWLGACALLAATLVWRDATRWLLHGAALLGLALALAVNVIGPAAVVSGQNLQRIVDPSGLPADAYRGLDHRYLISLGDGALPTILEELPRLGAAGDCLGSYLRTYVLERGVVDAGGPWQSFNVDRERARAALLSSADRLRDYPTFDPRACLPPISAARSLDAIL